MASPISASNIEHCPICMDTYNGNPSGFHLHPPTEEFPNRISHLFHKSCIEQWYTQSMTCPCCRQPAPLDEGLAVHIVEIRQDPIAAPPLLQHRAPKTLGSITKKIYREASSGAISGATILGQAGAVGGMAVFGSCGYLAGKVIESIFPEHSKGKQMAKELTSILIIGGSIFGGATWGMKGALYGGLMGIGFGTCKAILE